MARIFIDDTQLVHWQGKLAGIPRVMYELSRRFDTQASHDVTHITWVKEARDFAVYDFATTMAEGHIAYALPRGDAPAEQPTRHVGGSRGSLRATAKKIYLRLRLDRTAVGRRLKARVREVEAAGYVYPEPKAGDAIVITWGEWWDDNFLARLERAIADGVHVVPVIHDVLPFTRAPHLSGHSTDSLEAYCRRIVPHAALVLCVSQSTRDDLRDWLDQQGLPIPTFGVFRLGEDFTSPAPQRPEADAFVRSGLTGGDYMLTVGTVEARKNHALLYYVHKLARQRGLKLPPSVIVGRRGWKTEQVYDFITEDPEVREQFVFLHDAGDAELSWLYENALFTVIPSMYEGWGMPIAESVAKGVPCACANTTSMVEIAEGFVQHFSPFSTDECLEQMLFLLDEKNRAAAVARLAGYTPKRWDTSAADVLSMIEGLMNEAASSTP